MLRQRYACTACHTRFDDLTDTIFAGHHHPLKVWVLCLYFMGLNVSNDQIAPQVGCASQRCPADDDCLAGRSRKKNNNPADIEQPLTRSNLIKPTNCFPKQAKDCTLHVVKTCKEVVDLALHRHADAGHPCQALAHPTPGWPLGWLRDLGGEPLVLTRPLLAHSALPQRIDPQRERHHQPPPLHPARLLHQQR